MITCSVPGSWNANRKFSSPTHGESNTPRTGVKSWKAITTPNIGPYLKMSVRITAGSSIRCSGSVFWRRRLFPRARNRDLASGIVASIKDPFIAGRQGGPSPALTIMTCERLTIGGRRLVCNQPLGALLRPLDAARNGRPPRTATW